MREKGWRCWEGILVVVGGLLAATMVEGEESVVFMAEPPSLVMPSLSGELRSSPPPEKTLHRLVNFTVSPFLNHARRLGRLLPSKKYLPEHLAHREHWDYPGPLQWIPRGWTTYGWGEPVMVLGNQENSLRDVPKPIGERGSIQLSVYPELPVPFCWLPMYVAFTTPGGLHFRLGARWDDVDDYVNLPSIAIKKGVKK